MPLRVQDRRVGAAGIASARDAPFVPLGELKRAPIEAKSRLEASATKWAEDRGVTYKSQEKMPR